MTEGLNDNEKDAAFLHKDLKGESQKTTTGIHHLSDWSASHDLYHGKINGQHHATSVKRFKGNTGPNSLHKTGFMGRSHHDILKNAVRRDNPHLSSKDAHNVATQIHHSHPTVKEDLGSEDPTNMNNRRLSAIARNPNHPMSTHAKAELARRKVKKDEIGEAKDPNEYDNEGSMMKTQMNQITSAIDKLMGMIKDDENLPEWVQSKMTKATDYVRTVRDYLESEKMQEKTLTPAEIRKRDKIAKAIKRDDPDMPMDKKMAIATATAKRVAEEKDMYAKKSAMADKNRYKKDNQSNAPKVMEGSLKPFNELSVGKLSNYMRKSAADVPKARGDARRQDKRIGGQKTADDKIRKMQGKGSMAKVPATSEALNKDDMPHVSNLVKKLRKGSKTHAKQADDLEKAIKEAASPAMKKAADELNAYAKKSGGIDKADFMKTAKMLSTGKAGTPLIKFVNGQDTEVYEKILTVMGKHMGKSTIEKMFKIKIREAADYPHMMYDPKSGKKVVAKTPDDHNKYAKMGYTHEKPSMEANNPKPDHNMMAQRKSLDKIMKIINKGK